MTSAPPVLVARDLELADLEQRLLRVGEHGPELVLVTGVAGVGRSALVERLAVRRTGPVLRARGAAWETGRRNAVLHQLLPGENFPDDPVEAAEVFVRAVAAEGDPVLVVVDDAHWSDPASVQTLSSAVQHHRATAALIVLTVPLGDPDAPADTVALLRRVATQVVTLSPLGSRAVGEVAAAHGVVLHPSMAERLCEHTGGVPRHVVDLLDELPRAAWAGLEPDLPAPALVGSRVREALRDLTPQARQLVQAVAVLGAGSSIHEVARLAGLDDVLAPLDEARTAGLVRGSGPHQAAAVSPADSMVRAAVLDSMGCAAAAEAHRRAADLVDDEGRRLAHLVAASPLPDPRLADRLDAAAVERAAEGAWGAVASLLRDASRLTEDAARREERLTRAVDALIGAGDALGAAALVPEVESLRETPLRNAVLGYLAIVRGRVSEAETRLGRAWQLVNAERDPDVAALICQRFVLHALCRCRGGDLVAWADRAIELVGPEAPAGVEAAAIRGLGLAGTGRTAEALDGYRDLGQRLRHGAQAQRVAMGTGWLHLVVDDVDEARADLESAVPTTFLGGSSRISLWARGWLARAQFATGEWDLALRTVLEADDLLERSGIVLARPLLHWTAVQVHALRGDWDAAEDRLRRAETGAQDYELMRVPSHLARAQFHEARADYAAVLRALAPLTRSTEGSSIDEPGFWPWPDVYANALVLEGRYDDAEDFLAPHEERARARGHRSAQARLGYARGRLLGAQGRLDEAREVFEASLALLEGLPLRYDRARVNFAFGQTLRRAGKRREADAVISTARDSYAALGATTYVRRCERELKAGGLNVVRTDRAVDELTPQEQAVSTLVAKGLTNREVAAELFLSVKTVQYHLTRIYAKLGIRSRSELAAVRGPTSGADLP
ncbi:MAG TPA: LuxR C-terminal-related transcriptional regulator [Nocardioidaceae bacterium]|nr:LuxR C-terminal-related transcriptional regulator [Nocardioidaceae bacterium]